MRLNGENQMKLSGKNHMKLSGEHHMKLSGENQMKLSGENQKNLSGENQKNLSGENQMLSGKNQMLSGENQMKLGGGNEMELSDIQNFFAGQTIFITGGTGFLGKLIIEKLLRACYDLRKIYILVRVKKGISEAERFKAIFEQQCFEPLKRMQPNFMAKVHLVNGDCCAPDLGLSKEDKEILIREVTTIFHVAATVRFDQHLKSATYINVRSVRDILHLGKKMKQLKAIVHVSTAFSHSPRVEILEQFYETPISGQNLIKVMDSLDDDTVNEITPILIKEWPNTYVYTKAIAEEVIESEGKGLPIAMVRPAIVTPTCDEPVPGWVDNVYGVVGVVSGAGLGVIRTMPAGPDNYAEIVPADYVINSIIAAAWDIANRSSLKMELRDQNKNNLQDIPVYNYVSSPQLPSLTWGNFMDTTKKIGFDSPTNLAVWFYCFNLRPHPVANLLAIFLLHTIPAYIVDFILVCIGKKPMLVDGYKKINKFLDVIAYFARRDWKFSNKNVQALYAKLSEKDKELFKFDMGKLDITQCIKNGVLGGRQYLLKDPLDTIPQAKRRFRMLRIAHYALCAVLWYLLYKIVTFLIGYMV